ncbi:MAG: neuraminidase-like domain-containing protein, partial [Rubricella sp.]
MKLETLVALSRESGRKVSDLLDRQDGVGEAVRDIARLNATETVRSTLSVGSSDLAAFAERIDLAALQPDPGTRLDEVTLAALREADAPDAVIEEAKAILGGQPVEREVPREAPRPRPQVIADVVGGDAVVAGAPGLSALAELGRGARAGLALGLGENSVQKLVDGGVVIGRDIPGGAAGLVERQILTEREARQFERVNTVARVIGSDPGVAEKIARAPDTTKLAARPERFWLDLADAREDKTLKPETWARFTRARIEALHPGIALAQRLAVQPQRIGSAVERLTSAQERVEAPLFTAPVLTPDMLEGLTAAQSRQVLAAHGEVRALEGRFPGLGIAATLQSGQGNPRQRLERVQRRVSAAQTFLQNNDGFLELDLTRGGPGRESLDFTGVPAADRDAVFGFAQSYQRIHAVAGSPELTAKAAEAGFHSALQIAATPISDMTVTGVLDMAEAELLHDRALEIAPGVVGMWGGVLDKHRDWFDRTPFANPPTGIEKALKDIPGFEDYFGSQDFCDCTHCRSILGPAAYFVDLMRFVEESVTSRAFTGSDADHPLALKVRRPDLWTLPLTCENTNTLIPTLQIVSEVIEAYMADQLGFAGDLSDRAAVARFVYRDTLPGVVDGFSQPFVLPVEEIEVFLDHHDMTLRDIALLMGLTGEDMVRMGLGLSAEELAQITTPETGLARLRTLYGHEFTQSGGRISPFEPKRIYSRTGFDRHDFGRAIETGFATRNGTDALEIRGAKRSAESVQNDMEQARNFTRVALDRIRRMALVTRALGWSFDAFDVAHSQLQAAGLAGADLTVATLGSLLRVDLLREMLDLSLEESIACLTLIPLRATEHEGTALMDRLFNGKPYDSSTPWPAGANTILLPAFGPVGTTASPEVLRLQAGLRLDDEGLTNLVRALAPALGIDPLAESAPGVPDLAARGFGASQENLSLLYRHVLIADALDIDMSELGALIALAPGVAGSELSDFAEIRAFARFKGQLEAAKRSIDDVLYITGGTPSDPALYPDPAVAASDMIAAVASAQSLTFSDTLFTTVDGINETTSAAIFAANPAAVTDVDGAFRLTAAYDPTAPLALPADDPATGIEVPAAIRADGAPLHAVLEPRHAPAVISAAASAALTAEPDVFAAAVAMLGTDLSSAAMIDALTGDGPPAPLETLLAEAGPLCLALNGSALTPERLDFIAAERAGLFAMADPRAISVATLLRIDGYALRARALDRSGNTTDFEALLRAHAPATAFTTGDPQALADLLDCDVSLATGLQAALVLPTDPFEALDVLEEGVETARQLGVGASAFTQMASEDYDTLAAGSEALQAGFRSRFETEEDWAEKVEPYRDRILSRRRDGLVAYLINSITGDFEKPDDIYYYFLIDPQMEGCGRTSR